MFLQEAQILEVPTRHEFPSQPRLQVRVQTKGSGVNFRLDLAISL